MKRCNQECCAPNPGLRQNLAMTDFKNGQRRANIPILKTASSRSN